jgi:Ni,Fe-hydrogenase I large subunit
LDLIVHLQGLQQTELGLIKTAAFANTGLASVETARGLLVHQVCAEQSYIQSYQIVAPTEWNFHPKGSLACMLQTLRADNLMQLRQQAQALITALDPCVNYQLEIKSDA